ncbi:hypothetical protein [Pseudomonas paeninsulae]|uniref:hypothetical protein n=1 Tax=Pseudomonas paeninsulae TaxID=3110772 RepID=UPI002D79677B|nr:hypothetical protein [Pseudomonas sp. IT1137]
MSWLIPCTLFALAYLAWRWSWTADLWMHAVGRFVLACSLLSWAVVAAVVALVAG